MAFRWAYKYISRCCAVGLLAIPAISLLSCASFQLKPLGNAARDDECFRGEEPSPRALAKIEEDLRHAGALETKRVNLVSGVGMIDKSARLYVLNKRRFTLVFHLLRPIDLEIKNYRYWVKEDSKVVDSGAVAIDSKAAIGNVTDEYLYADFAEDKIKALAGGKDIEILIDDIPFSIPYHCREPFRSALGMR